MVTPCYHADRGNFYSKHPAVNKKQETIKKNWIPLDFRIDVKTMIIITLGWLNDKLDLSCSNYIGGSHIISSQDENLENKGKPQISLQWEVNCQDLRHLLHCWCLHCQSPIRATALQHMVTTTMVVLSCFTLPGLPACLPACWGGGGGYFLALGPQKLGHNRYLPGAAWWLVLQQENTGYNQGRGGGRQERKAFLFTQRYWINA